MSHYSVAVFHREDQSIEDLLAPYDEDITVAPYVIYTRDQAIQYAKEHWRKEYTDGKTDDELWESMAEGYETDKNGNIYSTYNPNSKWDWYQAGGRWGGILRLKPEARESYDGSDMVDEAFVRDIDFSMDQEEYEAALHFWDVVVDGQPQKDGEEIFSVYKRDFYLEYYETREKYAESMAQFSTFAVVTPNGVWHEKGKMGWFGMSSDTPEDSKAWHRNFKEEFLDDADPNWVLTIVDCHI